MNCPNCGAPLRLVEQRNYFVCDYCTTFHFPEAESPDGVVVLGEGDRDLACPVCGAELESAVVEGVAVLHCPECRGILVDQGSFLLIVKFRRARASGPPDRSRPLNQTDLERDINCPVCGGPMDTHPYYGPGNFVIDSCGHCALVWLDHGEVGVMTNAPGRDRRGWR